MKAVELTGFVNQDGEIVLDSPVTSHKGRVKVILMYPENEEIGEQEWLQESIKSPSYDFLLSEDENIYTIEDGKALDIDEV